MKLLPPLCYRNTCNTIFRRFRLPLRPKSFFSMILPIVAYGHPVLRKVAQEIDAHYPSLDKLIEDMWETMYASNGVGLAAPQVNKSIRLFVIDSAQIFANMDEKDKEEENYPDDPGIKQTFINAHIIEEL